jgi:hypothetical protein
MSNGSTTRTIQPFSRQAVELNNSGSVGNSQNVQGPTELVSDEVFTQYLRTAKGISPDTTDTIDPGLVPNQPTNEMQIQEINLGDTKNGEFSINPTNQPPADSIVDFVNRRNGDYGDSMQQDSASAPKSNILDSTSGLAQAMAKSQNSKRTLSQEHATEGSYPELGNSPATTSQASESIAKPTDQQSAAATAEEDRLSQLAATRAQLAEVSQAPQKIAMAREAATSSQVAATNSEITKRLHRVSGLNAALASEALRAISILTKQTIADLLSNANILNHIVKLISDHDALEILMEKAAKRQKTEKARGAARAENSESNAKTAELQFKLNNPDSTSVNDGA